MGSRLAPRTCSRTRRSSSARSRRAISRPSQQELMREFVDRRGGGLLLLGGRLCAWRMAVWGGSESRRSVAHRSSRQQRARFTATRPPSSSRRAGADSPITRLVDDPAKNIERWKKLPYLMDYQDAGTPKPGATVLAQMSGGRADDAVAGHGELRPWPHCSHGHLGHLALADEPAAGRHGSRSVLAAIAALAGVGHAVAA